MELIYDFLAEFHYAYVLGFSLLLFFLYQLTRHSKILSFTIIFIVPTGLTYFWLQHPHTPFLWIKLYSILFFMLWWYLCRLDALKTQKWMHKVFSILVVINLFEGVGQDGSHNHWLNAGAASLLIVTIFGFQSFRISRTKPYDLLWDTPILWIIGYNIWAMVLFYNNFTDALWLNLAILLTPIAIALWQREEWWQARIIALYWMMIIFFTHKEIYKPLLTSMTYNATTGLTVNIISFAWMVMTTVYIGYQKIKQK